MDGEDDLLRQIEALRERLSRLSEASLRINESLDFDTVLQQVARQRLRPDGQPGFGGDDPSWMSPEKLRGLYLIMGSHSEEIGAALEPDTELWDRSSSTDSSTVFRNPLRDTGTYSRSFRSVDLQELSLPMAVGLHVAKLHSQRRCFHRGTAL